ncbi:hypothetical protein KIN20_034910 [Parelaphostrongylus tenuis]|uniref:Uncharacterized protein n=1 Tax=Parelaphostrongylus tenuis TaxID=148309 RepID=A0AAD5RB42_PARTN|nr:hypothetical protein KIN20_034910 [Parelaphostrongylus tenuis]
MTDPRLGSNHVLDNAGSDIGIAITPDFLRNVRITRGSYRESSLSPPPNLNMDRNDLFSFRICLTYLSTFTCAKIMDRQDERIAVVELLKTGMKNADIVKIDWFRTSNCL